MKSIQDQQQRSSGDRLTPVIRLADANSAGKSWDRPRVIIYLWAVMELLFVTNSWQISSSIRVRVLRMFGAEIGPGVIFRPGTKVRFPWKLHIGEDCWIGEGVWFHNQDHVYVGNNVVVSQDTFLTTGSHRFREDMALVTSPIHIEDGVWVTARCVVLGGTRIGRSALITAGAVVSGDIPANVITDGRMGGQQDRVRFR